MPDAPRVVISTPSPAEVARARAEIAAQRIPDGPTTVQPSDLSEMAHANADALAALTENGWERDLPPNLLR